MTALQHISVSFGRQGELTALKKAWVLLQLGDLLTTLYVFHLGGYEANPLVARLLPITGALGGILVMKLIGCAIVIPIRSRWLLIAGVVLTSGILAWNLTAVAFGLSVH